MDSVKNVHNMQDEDTNDAYSDITGRKAGRSRKPLFFLSFLHVIDPSAVINKLSFTIPNRGLTAEQGDHMSRRS